MSHTDVVVIGAGQAGLAVSRLLSDRAVDHVVLERGRTAERWRSQGWDSLRLLTPNWLSRLPGWAYRGSDPAGFMRGHAVAGYLADYAVSFAAPVVEGAGVVAVRPRRSGYLVESTAGAFLTRGVVIATGACQRPAVPPLADYLHPSVVQLTPDRYRNPDSVPAGGVLVVGASATGAQLADELAAAGRRVVLSVGRHTGVPRRYRGLDIMWWLESMGVLHDKLAADRRRPGPSLQLVGGPDQRSIDLRSLAERGVELAGRLSAVEGRALRFADDLAATTAESDARLTRLLRRIDTFASATGLDRETDTPTAPRGTQVAGRPLHRLDVGQIRSVIWATGHRRDYPWLRVPILDGSGEIRQVDGRTPAPGVFVLGMPNQTRRSSTFLGGVRFDAELVADALLDHLGGRDDAVERSARRAS